MVEDSLKPPPAINFARIQEYALIDEWQRDSRDNSAPAETALDEGEGLAAVCGLAIGQRGNEHGVLLFHCDRQWKVLAVAPCVSLFEAEHLAERIYPGISSFWTDAQVSEQDAAWHLYQLRSAERCHFCHNEEREVSRLIEKNGARICEACVADCYELLREDDGEIVRTGS